MSEPTEQNPPAPEPETTPQRPEPGLNIPVAQEEGKGRDRLDAGALRQEISRKFQLYERPKLPEINAESVPKLLKLLAEIRDAKEREMVEAWARANDDVIRDKFPGVKTVSPEMQKQLIKEVEGEAYFAEEDETGEYRQLEVVFFDLDENRANASPETLISLVHFLNNKQVQLEGERASAASANNQEALQRVNEQVRDCFLLEENVHRVVSGGELPDLTREAELSIPQGDLDNRWNIFRSETIATYPSLLDRQFKDPTIVDPAHWTPWGVKVIEGLGYNFVIPKRKWYSKSWDRPVAVFDPSGVEVSPIDMVALEDQYKTKKTEEFKADLMPGALQKMKIEYLRNDFIDADRIEEQFEIAEKEIVSKTLAKRLETAQRRAGNRERVKDYKETLENQGLDMKGVIKDLMENKTQDEDQALRDILGSHGFEGDEYYNAFSPDDKQSLFNSKKRGVGYWVTTFMNLLNKLPV